MSQTARGPTPSPSARSMFSEPTVGRREVLEEAQAWGLTSAIEPSSVSRVWKSFSDHDVRVDCPEAWGPTRWRAGPPEAPVLSALSDPGWPVCSRHAHRLAHRGSSAWRCRRLWQCVCAWQSTGPPREVDRGLRGNPEEKGLFPVRWIDLPGAITGDGDSSSDSSSAPKTKKKKSTIKKSGGGHFPAWAQEAVRPPSQTAGDSSACYDVRGCLSQTFSGFVM